MDIKIIYPHIKKASLLRKRITYTAEWLVLLAAFVCPIVNLAVGGKAWSVIVVMSLYIVHTLILSTDLVEYNRISQSIKFVFLVCILLILIDLYLYPGWADFVTAIINCVMLFVAGVLFFTDFKKQKKNMLPMLWLIAISLIRSIIGICLADGGKQEAFIVMCTFSSILLLLFIITLRKDLLRELQCRFHTR